MRSRRPLFPAIVAVIAAIAVGPAAAIAQQPAVQAPDDAPIHRLHVEDWNDIVCQGLEDWTFEVPPGHWIELPIGWVAVDHGTAIANWDCMEFTILQDGDPIPLPDRPNWDLNPVSYECADRTIEGMALAPLIYLPPVDGSETYQIRYHFRADTDDGWSTYEAGSNIDVTLTLRNPPAAGGG